MIEAAENPYTSFEWRGDHDGHMVIAADGVELTIDRPGDLVAAMTRPGFAEDRHLCAAAAYGVVLSLRGVAEPHFVRQIVEKSITFVSSAQPESLPLYRTMNGLRKLLSESGELSGFELRDQLFAEAKRLGEAAPSK